MRQYRRQEPVLQSEPTEDIGLKVPYGWKRALMRLAAQQGVTFSQLVRDAIKQTYGAYLTDNTHE